MLSVLSTLKTLFEQEVKKSAGCTEIAAIGYAVAKAKEMTKEPYNIKIFLDVDTFKNAAAVGIPGGGFGIVDGIKKALTAKPKGLETFLTTDRFYTNQINLEIIPLNIPFLFIYTTVNDRATLIAGRHDNIIYVGNPIQLEVALKLAKKMQQEKNLLENIFDKKSNQVKMQYKKIVDSLDLIVSDKKIRDKIKEGIDLNLSLAKENLHSNNKYFGIARNLPENTLEEKIVKYAAAGVEARMGGSMIPAMAVAGSGNQGITTTVPLYIYAKEKYINEETLYRAVTLAWLTTIYATAFTRYVSPVCGAGIKAGVGLAAGFGYLLGDGQFEVIKNSIVNHLASIAGMLCDGAKPGCSLKVASAVQTAYRSAILASNNIGMQSIEGIIGRTVEETFINVGKYVDKISEDANDTIVKIINEKLIR